MMAGWIDDLVIVKECDPWRYLAPTCGMVPRSNESIMDNATKRNIEQLINVRGANNSIPSNWCRV